MTSRLRLMTVADIPGGMRLKEIAGWNQTPADWGRFLRASPQGCFVADADGQVVGTATTITYEARFAWIGMVLVDPSFRGQGVGTLLLRRTIEYLDHCSVPGLKLDATPQGKSLYEKLGFQVEYEIERWLLSRAPGPKAEGHGTTPQHFERIWRLDREVFGAERSELLRSLDGEAPEFTLEVDQHGDLASYAFGRRGTRADHLGPWMARNESGAVALLDEFLRRSNRETIFVDVMKSNPFVTSLLRERGFGFSRPLTRMVRGKNDFPGRPELLCAILGPEFG